MKIHRSNECVTLKMRSYGVSGNRAWTTQQTIASLQTPTKLTPEAIIVVLSDKNKLSCLMPRSSFFAYNCV